MPRSLSAESATARAIKRNPASMTKVARGQRPARFQAYTVSQLLETYRDPRAVLLEIAGTDTAKLATTLNCSMLDALAERRLCAQAVLPYVTAKLPVQVDLRHTRAIHLNLLSPAEFAEVENLANTAESPDDDGFSMQLISVSPAQETSQQADPTPEPQHHPGTAQNVESGDHETPVTPAVAAGPAGGYLRPEHEFWDQLSGARRQRIEDVPARDERDSWRRTHEGGIWPPDKPK